MNNKTDGTSNLYALLIGINCYLPNVLPGGGYYPSLKGCVRDINRVEKELLKDRLGMSEDNILKLTSTDSGNGEPIEPHDRWPTYENMVAAFNKLADMAKPGDQVYFHCSCHGGRIKTSYPELKGPDELDEGLVPNNIGDKNARYLRDIEIAELLKKMVDKGLIVTVAFDFCHSGGMTRGGGNDIAVRGISTIDKTPRPTESLVASHEKLAETWRSLTKGTMRNVNVGSGWLPEPKGYVLLAACRPSESALEYAFEGTERTGVLTYWLLDSLKQMNPGLTWKQVHDRILAKIHSQFASQTPQLQGESTRTIFGSDHIQSQYTVNVMDADMENKRIKLQTGQAAGINTGAEFAIYPLGTIDFTQMQKRIAVAEITEPGATESWAQVTNHLTADAIQQGAQAVLINPGRSMCRKVRLKTIVPETAREAIGNAIKQSGRGYVEEAGDDEPVAYQVAIENGEYKIWDPAGIEFTNIRPAIKISDNNAAMRVVQRLVHLSKYHTIAELDNIDLASPLAGKLTVELFKAPPGYACGQHPVNPPELADPGNTPTLKAGEKVLLHIRNDTDPDDKSSPVLNVAVLDLQPDWGISQVYPPPQRGDYVSIDPGKDAWEPMEIELPPDYNEGTDILKVFATIGPANFRWLSLPPLDQQFRSASDRGVPSKPRNPLEQLLADINAEVATTRHMKSTVSASEEWIEAEVKINVQRQPWKSPN